MAKQALPRRARRPEHPAQRPIASRTITRRMAAGGLAAVLAGLAAGPVAVIGSASAASAPAAAPRPSLLGWGEDTFGQLGDGRSGLDSNGNDVSSSTPIPPALTRSKIVAAATGCEHTVVQTASGHLLAWGDNARGQLGNGTSGGTQGLTTAQQVQLPAGVKVTDVQATCRSTIVLTSTGQVLAWGDDSLGELGDGGAAGAFSDVPVPVHLPTGTQVTAISTSEGYTLALTSAGQVLAWGVSTGELAGQPSDTVLSTPTPISFPGGTTITAVAAGVSHALFLTKAGTVLATGDNTEGELGTGQFGPLGNDREHGSATPVEAGLPAGTTVTALAAGDDYSLALTSTGAVLAWGFDGNGTLGDAAPDPAGDKASPVLVALPGGVKATAISAHNAVSLALTSTGLVYAWGVNRDGELGNGTISDHNGVPAQVLIPSALTATGLVTGDLAETGFALVQPRR